MQLSLRGREAYMTDAVLLLCCDGFLAEGPKGAVRGHFDRPFLIPFAKLQR